MKVTLTYKQKQERENQHDKTRDGRVRDCIKAVLLASEGWSTAMISQAAIGRFFTVILPEIASSLASRINDNFQVLNPASSS